MIVYVGQEVSIECCNENFESVILDVIVLEIIVDVTDFGFKESGTRLLFVEYRDIGITNNDHNQNHIITFDHPGTDYKWAHLYQIREGVKNVKKEVIFT